MVRGLPLLALVLLAAPAAAEPLQITTSTLDDAYVGSSYRRQLSATGGSLAYTWSSLDPEPEGLALSTAGVLEGKPTHAGDYVLRVRVKSGADSATASLPLHVIDTANPLVIATTSLPTAFVNEAYSTQLVAQGGEPPYTWSLGAGAPAWLMVSADVLSGVPDAEAAPVTFTITVTDARSVRVEGDLSIKVAPKLDFRITSATLPDATVGQAYGQTLTAEGGVPPYAFTVDGLPSGLELVPGTETATLEGIPLESGLFPLEVQARDADLRFARRTVYLSCRAGEVEILTETLPNAQVGKSYAVKLQSDPTMATWTVASGELPPGLTLGEDGVISGKPAKGSAGLVYAFLVNATIGGSMGDRALSIAVDALPEPPDPGGGGCECGGGQASVLGLVAVLGMALLRRRR